MLTMTMHDKCSGTGRQHGYTAVSVRPDGSWKFPYTTVPELVDDGRPEPRKCIRCAGIGIAKKKRYAGQYRSAKAAQAQVTRGNAITCPDCQGTGDALSLTVWEDCYGCRGRGTTPAFDADVDPIIPEDVNLTESASDAFVRAWVETLTIVVHRRDAGVTWMEANLGIGGLWSSVDYGNMARRSDDAIIEAMRTQLVDSSWTRQFCKFTDKNTRRVGNVLVVSVARNGYTPIVTDVERAMPLLPPTYTPEVLGREWGT